MKNVKGFSLIELLVVVAIIGVLAAAGVVGYQNYTDTAKKNVHDNNVGQVLRYIKNQSGIAATGVATGSCGATNIGACSGSAYADLPGYLETYFSDAGFTNPFYKTDSDAQNVVSDTSTHHDCTNEEKKGVISVLGGNEDGDANTDDLTVRWCEGDDSDTAASQSINWAS